MKIEKFNEFINYKSELLSLIEECENTNKSDPEEISNHESYKKIIEIGTEAIPYLVGREKYLWNIALEKITGINSVGQTSTQISEFWKNWLNNEIEK